ncbi:hypothetical protein DPMN_137899 [Dreissena polymorpha]|uniref:Uncharacterized protein n=1 Tax=Dreissena polymorpha TaxID=45954 RepID=A0A9D4JE41_DREPO|nr:hypothetical protein DPMN_137899 [Dreissena polymorpha]
MRTRLGLVGPETLSRILRALTCSASSTRSFNRGMSNVRGGSRSGCGESAVSLIAQLSNGGVNRSVGRPAGRVFHRTGWRQTRVEGRTAD